MSFLQNARTCLKRALEGSWVGLLAVFLAAAIVLYIHDSRPLRALEELNFAAWVTANPGEPSRQVELIDIDDHSYKTDFKDKSPLDRELVRTLVRRALCAGAAVVAVDIDTSEWPDHDLERDCPAAGEVIWGTASKSEGNFEIENSGATRRSGVRTC